jgi:hypothetical protein
MILQSQTGLVYADIVSSTQRLPDSILNFDNRVEYAQVQEPDDKHLSVSSDIENHAPGW